MRRTVSVIIAMTLLLLLAACGGEEPTIATTKENDDHSFSTTKDLYIKALDDVWNADPSLTDDINVIGFDLSSTSLTDEEKDNLMAKFSKEHGILVTVSGTLDELIDQGIISKEDMYWSNGVLLSIDETEMSDFQIVFTAKMWRSGTGAYALTDCVSSKNADGSWSDYLCNSVEMS